jgi:plasmid maintenance system killer protein
MIKTFRDRDTERIFKRERIKRFSMQLQKPGARKLDLLSLQKDGLPKLKDLPKGNGWFG